jgi:TonB family protein
LGSCNADVAIRGNWVDIQTDHRQCARVDYFIDGIPFVAMVVEGQDRQDWLSRTEQPEVFVQSCQVCQDNSASPAAPPPSAPPQTAAGELEPLIRIAPSYPAAAQARGLEGFVTVQFAVTEYGTVENASVAESAPAGVFDQAALAAIRRWRYPAAPGREALTLSERLVFNLDEAVWQMSAPVSQAAGMAPAAAPVPRNECVRESIAYNYGEMVEIGLINACTEPLLVFGCAEGTGEHTGLWVCIDSERLATVLLRPGDGRVGGSTILGTDAGARTFAYGDRFFVARAPNTEYWWIACKDDDVQCRERARQWTRSLDRQLASIDPRGRSSLTLARSY